MVKPSKENKMMQSWEEGGHWEGTETLRHNMQFKHPLFFRGKVRCFRLTSLILDLGDILLRIQHSFLYCHKLFRKLLNLRCMALSVKSSLFHHFTP